jgi:hypothetical protein
MPYYLSEIVQAGPRRKVVRGAEEPGANWIVRDRGRAILWVPSPVTEQTLLRKFADDAGETMAVASRTLLSNFSDKVLPSRTVRQTIVDLLRFPEAGRSKPLSRPSKQRRRYEIWLGPGGRGKNLLWSAPAQIGPSTKTFVDNFNRTAGNLDGSTSSDANFTWDEIDGTGWVTNGTQAALGTGITEFATAQAAANLDTSDNYSQVVLSDWTLVLNTLSAGVVCRFSASSGYSFETITQIAVGATRILKYYVDDTPLDSDTTVTQAGTLYVEADGSSISASADTEYPTGLRCGIVGFSAHASNSFRFDNYECGDIVTVTKSKPLFSRSVRSWRRSA